MGYNTFILIPQFFFKGSPNSFHGKFKGLSIMWALLSLVKQQMNLQRKNDLFLHERLDMNRGVSWCWRRKCFSIFWKVKRIIKKTDFRLFKCTRRYSQFTLSSQLKNRREGGGGAGGGGKGCLYAGYRRFLYYHGLFLDNMIGFETAERLLQYLKDSNTWEQ